MDSINKQKLDQDFINRQFHSMRAQLLSLVEEEVDAPAAIELIKKEIKTITSRVWDKFTLEFGDEEAIETVLQYKNKRRGVSSE